MDEDVPVIYGIDFQARSLASQAAESDSIRFLIGTQSLRQENQIQLIDFEEDTNAVSRTVFSHPAGEVWNISCSPFDGDLFGTCYTEVNRQATKIYSQATLWRLPASRAGSATPRTGAEDTQSQTSQASIPKLEEVCSLSSEEAAGDTVGILWEPTGLQKKVISLKNSTVTVWALDGSSQAQISSSITLEGKGHTKVVSGKWSPHHSSNIVGVCTETAVRGVDLRVGKPSYTIENPHGYMVRQIDFNQNKPYDVASCGDDCTTKIWDVRNPSEPLRVLADHSHWVWCVKYNPFHDQLLLTSSSDSKVILTSIASLSSEPITQGVDEEEHYGKEVLPDGVLNMYQEHEDSVYALEWSTADPWTFASLSYDGRLVINRVPRHIKYKILQV